MTNVVEGLLLDVLGEEELVGFAEELPNGGGVEPLLVMPCEWGTC
jgi:hypothetical protein